MSHATCGTECDYGWVDLVKLDLGQQPLDFPAIAFLAGKKVSHRDGTMDAAGFIISLF